METSPFPAPLLKAPESGDLVCWRCLRHARVLGWDQAYGGGPFVVLRVVDHGSEGIPRGIVVRTNRGEREINEVWLALVPEEQGYSPETLDGVLC